MRNCRLIVEEDGTVWEIGEEAWAAIEHLFGFEADDDREMAANTRASKTLPPPLEYQDAETD